MKRNSLQKIMKKGSEWLVHYFFGDMLRQARKELHMTQEELAFGICSVGTISKIENGTSVPRRRNYEALLQRVGKSSCMQQLQLSHAEAEQESLMYEIQRCIADNAVERAGRLLKKHFPKEKQPDALSRQFVQSMWAIVFSRRGMPPDEVMEMLNEALSLTGLNAEASMTLKRFYTFDEIIILNNIAIQYLRKKEYREAFLLWDGLRNYLEKRPVDAVAKGKVYPMILYNYALMCADMGMREQCQKLCHEGIRFCEKQGQMSTLPYLLDCLSRNTGTSDQEATSWKERSDALFDAMTFHYARRMEPIYMV
ncbi:MAG: helix-turn-helix domain-containing protein [Roseburia sp.]